LDVNITDGANWEKNLEIKVPYEKLKPKINESYQQYKKSIQLEGFRKGKVPLDLIKKVFGTKIETEVAEKSMSDFLQQAIDENKIKFHSMREVSAFKFDEKDGLVFTAVIRIEPEIELSKYKSLKFEKEVYEITDADVDLALKNMREQYATMVTVEGEARENHFLIADLQKTDSSGHPIIGEKFDNRYFQLGGEHADDEFVQQLLGIKAGEKRQISLKAQNEPEGAGEKDYFEISVKEIKEKKLPELDDEFAKNMGGFENLDEFKKMIQENLESQAKSSDKEKFEKVLIDQVNKNNPFDLPDFMVEDYMTAIIENMKKEPNSKIDENEIREKYKADAVSNLKWMLIKDKIAEIEDLKIEPDELKEHIENLAKEAGDKAPDVRKTYKNSKRREQLERELLEQRVFDFIIENSKVKVKNITFEDLQKTSKLIK